MTTIPESWGNFTGAQIPECFLTALRTSMQVRETCPSAVSSSVCNSSRKSHCLLTNGCIVSNSAASSLSLGFHSQTVQALSRQSCGWRRSRETPVLCTPSWSPKPSPGCDAQSNRQTCSAHPTGNTQRPLLLSQGQKQEDFNCGCWFKK